MDAKKHFSKEPFVVGLEKRARLAVSYAAVVTLISAFFLFFGTLSGALADDGGVEVLPTTAYEEAFAEAASAAAVHNGTEVGLEISYPLAPFFAILGVAVIAAAAILSVRHRKSIEGLPKLK